MVQPLSLPMPRCAFFLLILLALLDFVMANGNEFLSNRRVLMGGKVADALAAALEGRGPPREYDVATLELEEAARSIFGSVPQDASGKVTAESARYVLRRALTRRHGWHMHALEADASDDGVGLVATSRALASLVGNFGDSFARARRAGDFSFKQIVDLALAFEGLVRDEDAERLRKAVLIAGLHEDDPFEWNTGLRVLEVYMALLLNIDDFSTTLPEELDTSLFALMHPHWLETIEWITKALRSVSTTLESNEGELSLWVGTLRAVNYVTEHYRDLQHRECKELRNTLLELQAPSTPGRVPLVTFYEAVPNNTRFHFRESESYLLQLGALDASIAEHPLVVVANYLSSPANCVGGSAYYQFCCESGCERLFGELERRVGAPTASVEVIQELLAILPIIAPRSDEAEQAVEGGARELSASSTVTSSTSGTFEPALDGRLLDRLKTIAAHHGGVVPIHGRLFAQLMHHAFPRECPFPQKSTREIGESGSWLTEEEARNYVERHPRQLARANVREAEPYVADVESVAESDAVEAVPAAPLRWTAEEELFVSHTSSTDDADSHSMAVNVIMIVSGAVVILISLVAVVRKALNAHGQPGHEEQKATS
eukprot:TRINITY_DN21623_c0_g1_i1.p1 TRINITY_DN21623_c0_g1~~TRINITY_DN21623_c0_g1_i1.p1  ORF type:complete len:603 (-),score=94.46 TRINITY_DN21623_c0_g1_i1:121-1929(-)